MNAMLRLSLAAAGMAVAAQATADVTFYEREGFEGRSFTTTKRVGALDRYGFNDRASSVVVTGTDRWEVCDDAQFKGQCVILRPGRYPSLAAMNLNNRVSSARMVNSPARVEPSRYAPAPAMTYDYRRRRDERVYEADVTSVRAVLGTPEQRCWVERGQVTQERSGANVPGAIAGAIIGGILGHQIGSGRGNDVATVGGVVAGGVVGANVGRDGTQTYAPDVKRCENVAGSGQPDYWDVTYNFRGVEHRIQMTSAPGPKITVNEQGEPRA